MCASEQEVLRRMFSEGGAVYVCHQDYDSSLACLGLPVSKVGASSGLDRCQQGQLSLMILLSRDADSFVFSDTR